MDTQTNVSRRQQTSKLESSRLNGHGLQSPLTTIAFWGAIGLPVLYLPLFIIGFTNTVELALFLTLVTLHLLTLFGGRNHRRRQDHGP
jgi:hypothetical protein